MNPFKYWRIFEETDNVYKGEIDERSLFWAPQNRPIYGFICLVQEKELVIMGTSPKWLNDRINGNYRPRRCMEIAYRLEILPRANHFVKTHSLLFMALYIEIFLPRAAVLVKYDQIRPSLLATSHNTNRSSKDIMHVVKGTRELIRYVTSLLGSRYDFTIVASTSFGKSWIRAPKCANIFISKYYRWRLWF